MGFVIFQYVTESLESIIMSYLIEMELLRGQGGGWSPVNVRVRQKKNTKLLDSRGSANGLINSHQGSFSHSLPL